MSGWSTLFFQPWWLLLLVPIMALWLLFARVPAARLVPSGTLGLWKQLSSSTSQRGARWTLPPPFANCLAGCLALCALALAGPGRAPVAKAQATIVLDLGPSMQLPDGDTSSSRTRLESAVERAQAWLVDRHASEVAIWIDPLAPGASVRAARPPSQWLAPGVQDASPADWRRFDQPGVLWISDHVPCDPLQAELVCLGARAVPGPVAVDGADRVDWDGSALQRQAGQAPELWMELDPGLGRALADVVAHWAGARGIQVHSPASAPGERERTRACLVIEASGPATGRPLDVTHQGWSAPGVLLEQSALASAVARPRVRSVWLQDAQHGALVTWTPGRIECSWYPTKAPQGDAGDTALSFARLFEAALVAPPPVVSAHARARQSGPSNSSATHAGARPVAQAERSFPASRARASAVLCLLAAGLGLLGLWMRQVPH